MSDCIIGNAHKSVDVGYGAPTLDDMAAALKKFPRYKLKGRDRAGYPEDVPSHAGKLG